MHRDGAQRIVFLDYLRAIACLLVVLGHVYFMGLHGYKEFAPWVPGLTGHIFGPDAVSRSVLATPSIWVGINLGINVGALGVSIFFLISGFVILRAVERETTKAFLVRRVFRIYPVCITAVLLAAAAITLYCVYAGSVSPHTISSVISSALLMNGFQHLLDTVPVTWSLEVELFFYLLMAVMAHLGRLGSRSILGAGVLCMSFALAVNAPGLHLAPAWLHVGQLAVGATFLLVGCMLYRLTTDDHRMRSLVYTAVSICIFIVTSWGVAAERGARVGGVDFPNAFWALSLFALALWSGMRWSWIRPLRWIADLSYPLYMVHVPLGWITLAVLGGRGWGMASASAATAGVILFTAWVLHTAVEKPAQRAGARLTRSAQGTPRATAVFS